MNVSMYVMSSLCTWVLLKIGSIAQTSETDEARSDQPLLVLLKSAVDIFFLIA